MPFQKETSCCRLKFNFKWGECPWFLRMPPKSMPKKVFWHFGYSFVNHFVIYETLSSYHAEFAWRCKVKSRDTPPHYFVTVWQCFLVNHRNITLFGGGSNNSCSLSRVWSAVDRHYLWKTSIIDVLGYIIHQMILFESCTISTKAAW